MEHCHNYASYYWYSKKAVGYYSDHSYSYDYDHQLTA